MSLNATANIWFELSAQKFRSFIFIFRSSLHTPSIVVQKAKMLVRHPLIILAAGGFVSSASMRVAEPLLPDIAEQFSTTVTEAATLITTFVLACGVFQLVHGPLGDRHGKLRVVCIALFLAAFSSAACATSQSLQQLSFFRFLSGMTAGAVIPLALAYVGDTVPFDKRQQVMGRFISGMLLGSATGPVFAGFCSQYFDWRMSFVLIAIGFFAIGLCVLPIAMRESKPVMSTHGGSGNLMVLIRSPAVRFICLVVAVEGCLFYGAFAYLGAFFRQQYSLEFSIIGLLLAGFGCGGVLYSASVGLLVEKLGVVRMVLLGGLLLLGGFTGLSVVGDWHLAGILVFVLGFGFYMIHNTLQNQASEMAPAARGSAIAIFAFSLFVGQAIGVAVDGQIVAYLGYRSMLIFSGVGLVILAVLLSRRIATGIH